MSLPPLDEFMAIDPNSYLESVPGWGAELKALASDFTEYKPGVYAPGGTDWWGKTATAAQDKAGEDSNAIAAIHDTVNGLVSEVTSAVTYSVVPPLTNGHSIVDKARQSEGVTVNQDYTMTYSPPQGMSDEQADKNRQTVAAAAQELKSSADKWYSASQGSLMIGSALLSMAALSGCHASVDVGNYQRISKSNLEQGLKAAVKEKQHFDLQSADCEGPLDGKIDATQKCTVVDDEGTKYSVLVTTTSVNGDDIKFKYKAEPINKPA